MGLESGVLLMSEEDASEDSDPFSRFEDEYGVEIPGEVRVDLLEAAVHHDLTGQESPPDGLIRLFGLRRVNDLYGQLQEGVDEVNRILESVHEENPEMDKDVEEELTVATSRMVFYEDALLFFLLAHDLIETFSIQLLERELILEDYQGSNKTWDALDRGIRSVARQDLLRRTGLIDGDVLTDMDEVRKTRNKIAHRTVERQEFDFGPDILELADSALHALNELRFELDGERFWDKKQ